MPTCQPWLSGPAQAPAAGLPLPQRTNPPKGGGGGERDGFSCGHGEGTFRDIPCSQSRVSGPGSAVPRKGVVASLRLCLRGCSPSTQWRRGMGSSPGKLHAWNPYLFVFIVGSSRLQRDPLTSGTGPHGSALSLPIHTPSLPPGPRSWGAGTRLLSRCCPIPRAQSGAGDQGMVRCPRCCPCCSGFFFQRAAAALPPLPPPRVAVGGSGDEGPPPSPRDRKSVV